MATLKLLWLVYAEAKFIIGSDFLGVHNCDLSTTEGFHDRGRSSQMHP